MVCKWNFVAWACTLIFPSRTARICCNVYICLEIKVNTAKRMYARACMSSVIDVRDVNMYNSASNDYC